VKWFCFVGKIIRSSILVVTPNRYFFSCLIPKIFDETLTYEMEVPEHNSATKILLLRHKIRLMVIFLEGSLRIMNKNYETEMYLDENKLPLNNFVQETIDNIIMGFSKTLKGLEGAEPDLIEVKIKRLSKSADVDAHIYPVN
jgi:hypothetical protein